MFFLKRNLPSWERATRIAIGALIVWGIMHSSLNGAVLWGAIATAATMVLTAFIGFCPACAMIGRRYLEQ